MKENMTLEHETLLGGEPNLDAGYEMKYNTKHIELPEENEEYHSVRRGPSIADFYGKAAKETTADNLENFISKANSMHSVFAIKDRADFLMLAPDFNNPFRKIATVLTTDADSIEVPTLGTIKAGWEGAEQDMNQAAAVEIKLFGHCAKVSLPRSFLSKISGHVDYLMSHLSRNIAAYERAAFAQNGRAANGPMGITKTAGVEILDVQGDDAALRDGIFDCVYKLNAEYRGNACFVMSSAMQSRLARIKDQHDHYLLADRKMIGYDVHTVDELDDVVLFGDFKSGYVIVDKNGSELRRHESYDRPMEIGFSLPIYTGAAVVDPKAIRGIKVAAVAAE